MIPRAQVRRIEPYFVGKVWGSPRIEPWFESRGDEKTGEVWFPAGDLLIKFLFTSENLSVQVHPDDHYARRHANARGKTEMWHILRVEPGARIALGFREPLTPRRLMTASESGEIMDLLNWIEVQPGDTYFVPAGTVHAIGAGIALCEIQQNSDVTYRLFDYGRNRELHLESAGEVAGMDSHPGRSVPREIETGIELLVECPWFQTYSATVSQPRKLPEQLQGRLLVVLEGTARVNGLDALPGYVFEGSQPIEWLLEPASSMKVLLIA